MLDEGVGAEPDEDNACEDVGGLFGHGNVAIAKKPSYHRDHEGDYSYDKNREKGLRDGVIEPKPNAYHEGVDAGGNAQKAHDAETGDVELFVVGIGVEGFPYHTTSYEKKQEERNPMVDGLDVCLECGTKERTQKGKQRLEEAKDVCHGKPPPQGHLALEGAGGGNHQAVDAEG